jgi:NAD(P)-dependent dehydrogenase (short-subunit alcohol dehydrogenase family)
MASCNPGDFDPSPTRRAAVCDVPGTPIESSTAMPTSAPALPLFGRTALVTGASRRRGIGFTVATSLASLGASVFPGDRGPAFGPFERPTGHIVWMTSGQQHAPMRGEVAYATSKAALAGITRTVAAELLDVGLVLNTINPGPVNTGYLDAGTTDRELSDFETWLPATPFGRVGRPEDPAGLIGWLCTEAGSWVVGEVLTSDGGFSLG